MEQLKKEHPNPFLDEINQALDITSNGMGVQLNAVLLLYQGRTLPYWAKESVQNSGSNYIGSSYVNSWVKKSDYSFHIKHYAPLFNKHKNLLAKMRNEYSALQWEIFRLVFTGEENLADHPERPITQTELPSYLNRASELNLVTINKNRIPNIEGINNPNRFFRELIKQGVDISDEFLVLFDTILFSNTFRSKLLQAATHKLGSMLGITDQLVYDAYVSGKPIPASYQPNDLTGNLHKAWQEAFGQQMPTIKGLYEQAYQVFTQVANRRDPFVIHLFTLDTSKYFIK